MTRLAGTFLLSTALLAPSLLTTSCAETRVGVGFRYYDPGHSDYHVWDDHERVYYNQWATENHRDQKDFRKLKRGDQQEYWRWRHDHPDRR